MILLWILIKKNHPQVYLEECEYRPKKIQMSRFINTELKIRFKVIRFRFRFRKNGRKSWCWINDKIRKIWFWFWIRHFTLNKFYPYFFADFEQVLLMPIFLRGQFFSQGLFQTFLLLGLKIHKNFLIYLVDIINFYNQFK